MGASASLYKDSKSSSSSSSSECMIVSIDGNIGSGKTTGKAKLNEYIMSLKRKNDNSVIFVDEPTGEWEEVKDENGVPILTNLYSDVKRFAFRFQMMAYITRLKKLRQALKTPNVRLIITERCLLTDAHVFAKMLYDSKKIEQDEYDIYTRWFDEFAKEVQPSCIIYFKASTEVCMKRIQKRNRPGESNISFEYLEECNRYHDDWLNFVPSKITIPTLILNAEVDSDVYNYSQDIYNFINNLRASKTLGVMHRLKTYVDGNQFNYTSEERENMEIYYGWYKASPPSREDRMNLVKLGHASYLHFDA
jgi:deoxyadenosine/deoxycytidine kinase